MKSIKTIIKNLKSKFFRFSRGLSVDLQPFYQELTKKKLSFYYLPKNTVYHSEKNTTLVVQAKPCKRTIDINGHKIFLSFPYIYFVIMYSIRTMNGARKYKLECLKVATSHRQLLNLDEEVYMLPLPNYIDTELTVCTGNYYNNYNNLALLSNMVISDYWSSSFGNYRLEIYDPIWEEATEANCALGYLQRHARQVKLSQIIFGNKNILNKEFKNHISRS